MSHAKNSGIQFMPKTFIIGTGYLSSMLSKKIKDSEIIPSENLYKKFYSKLIKIKKKLIL